MLCLFSISIIDKFFLFIYRNGRYQWQPYQSKLLYTPDKNVYFCSLSDMDDLVKYMGSPAGALTVGVVAGASALYMASRPKPIDTILDLQNQSQEVPVGR